MPALNKFEMTSVTALAKLWRDGSHKYTWLLHARNQVISDTNFIYVWPNWEY